MPSILDLDCPFLFARGFGSVFVFRTGLNAAKCQGPKCTWWDVDRENCAQNVRNDLLAQVRDLLIEQV